MLITKITPMLIRVIQTCQDLTAMRRRKSAIDIRISVAVGTYRTSPRYQARKATMMPCCVSCAVCSPVPPRTILWSMMMEVGV